MGIIFYSASAIINLAVPTGPTYLLNAIAAGFSLFASESASVSASTSNTPEAPMATDTTTEPRDIHGRLLPVELTPEQWVEFDRLWDESAELEGERYDESGELTPEAVLDERYSH